MDIKSLRKILKKDFRIKKSVVTKQTSYKIYTNFALSLIIILFFYFLLFGKVPQKILKPNLEIENSSNQNWPNCWKANLKMKNLTVKMVQTLIKT